MGRACNTFFWVLFWTNWIKYAYLGCPMGEEDFMFPTVAPNDVIHMREQIGRAHV